MSEVTFQRGLAKDLTSKALKDGSVSFTTDDGRIHLDYVDQSGELKRKTFYSGKLIFGDYIYDGTKDVIVNIYEGTIEYLK